MKGIGAWLCVLDESFKDVSSSRLQKEYSNFQVQTPQVAKDYLKRLFPRAFPLINKLVPWYVEPPNERKALHAMLS